jgi:DNA-binding CsgD family transcriptional regulator
MSVLSEQHSIEAYPATQAEDDVLFFAAASIVREMTGAVTARPVREVVVGEQRYRLEGRRLQTSTDTTGPVVLVHVQPTQADLPSIEVLRSRFGLTRKEACVARLIAEDQTNEEIATELSISPHTARHHTERVLAKLDVKSRTKVRTALLKSSFRP